MTTATTPPVTYGTAQTARAYVAGILAAPAPAGTPAWVTAAPSLRASAAWDAAARNLAAMLPGIPLRMWGDLPPGRARPRALPGSHSAVIVVAVTGDNGHRVIGPVALAEAEAFTAARRPVLVFTGARLAAWPDIAVRPCRLPGPGRAAVLDVPARPPRPLPTLAASLRALGITDPRLADIAAGIAQTAPAAVFRPAGKEQPQ